MSVETSGSSLYWRMPSSAPAVRLGGERLVDLLLLVARDDLADEVDHRAGDHRRAHGDAVQLAVELGQHEADGLGGAGRGRHQVDGRGARAAQVLVRGVLEVLVGRVGVDRGHDPALDPDRVVEHLGHRRQAVGRARGVGDHVVLLRVVGVVVDAQRERHVRLGGRRGDDHLLGAGVEVLGGVVALGEEAGRLDHHVGADVGPGQRRPGRARRTRAARRRRRSARSRWARPRPGTGPRIESYLSRWASVFVSVMSLTPTQSMSSPRACAARKTLRPMRPKPLIPAFKAIRDSFVVRSALTRLNLSQGRRGGFWTSRWTTSTSRSPRAAYTRARCSAITTERWRPPVQPMPTVRCALPSCSYFGSR